MNEIESIGGANLALFVWTIGDLVGVVVWVGVIALAIASQKKPKR